MGNFAHHKTVFNDHQDIKTVIIDDDFFVRSSLSKLIKRINPDIKIHKSVNGIEGLGMVFAIQPQIMVVDLTLPKYSGRNILEFIIHNEVFKKQKNLIIALSESSHHETISPKIKFVNKSSSNVGIEVETLIRKFLHISDNHLTQNFHSNLDEFLVKYTNEAEFARRNFFAEPNLLIKTVLLIKLIFMEIINLNLYLIILLFDFRLTPRLHYE